MFACRTLRWGHQGSVLETDRWTKIGSVGPTYVLTLVHFFVGHKYVRFHGYFGVPERTWQGCVSFASFASFARLLVQRGFLLPFASIGIANNVLPFQKSTVSHMGRGLELELGISHT